MEQTQSLTDERFWQDYWQQHAPGAGAPRPQKLLFHKLLRALVRDYSISSALEIGGSPGTYTAFLHTRLGVADAWFLDFVIPTGSVAATEKAYGMQPGSLSYLQADLMSTPPARNYQLVYSLGLIEHFDDPVEIVARHINYLSPGGILFIALPNLRGINGWLQRTYDPSFYAAHNLTPMDLSWLTNTCQQEGLQVLQARYLEPFSIWLEPRPGQPTWRRRLVKWLSKAGKIPFATGLFPQQWYRPYMGIVAQKPL